jgi:hypothetical protein
MGKKRESLSPSRFIYVQYGTIEKVSNFKIAGAKLKENCSHFMGSSIPLTTSLLLIQQMIEVRYVNWGGYYPGGRRSILACSEHVQSKVTAMRALMAAIATAAIRTMMATTALTARAEILNSD